MGALYWNGEKVDRAGLRQKLAAASKQEPQPEIHLRGDKDTSYHYVAEVMADNVSIWGRMISTPTAQLRPMLSMSTCATDVQKASTV